MRSSSSSRRRTSQSRPRSAVSRRTLRSSRSSISNRSDSSQRYGSSKRSRISRRPFRRTKHPIPNRPNTLDKRVRFCLRTAGTFRHKLGYRRRPPVGKETFYALSDSAFQLQNIVLKNLSAQMGINELRDLTLDNVLKFFELSGSHQNIVDKALQISRERENPYSRRSRTRSSSPSPNRSKSSMSPSNALGSRTSLLSTRGSKLSVNDNSKQVNSQKSKRQSSKAGPKQMKQLFRPPNESRPVSRILGSRKSSPNLSRNLSSLSRRPKVSEVKYTENPRFVRSQRPLSKSSAQYTKGMAANPSTGAFTPSAISVRSRQASTPMVRSPQNSSSDMSLSPMRLDSSSVQPSQRFGKIQHPQSNINVPKFIRHNQAKNSAMYVNTPSQLSQNFPAGSQTSLRSREKSQMSIGSRKASSSGSSALRSSGSRTTQKSR